MILYKLECINEDGQKEDNGYFLSLDNAIKQKDLLDNCFANKKYGILQDIIEIKTED